MIEEKSLPAHRSAPPPPALAGADLTARAARLHFEFGLTHQETAEALGLSRVKVTRLIKLARQSGLVKVIVDSRVSPFAELEGRLLTAFDLREAIIVPTPGNGADGSGLRAALARGAASYLERVARDGLVVAVGLSRTIGQMPRMLVNPRPAAMTFVSLVGAIRSGGQGSGNPYQATDALAAAFGGQAENIHAPVLVQDPAVALHLRADPAIAGTLERAAAATIAFVGIGGVDDRINFSHGANITDAEWAGLLDRGMVGDIGGRFFDARGQEIDSDINGRIIGLSLDAFRKIPSRVAAAGGPSKVGPLAAAMHGGLINILVTDVATARVLLEGA